MGIGMVSFCLDSWLYPKVGGFIFNLYLDMLTLLIQLIMRCEMISTIKNSVINYFIPRCRWFLNPSGHTWPLPRLFIVQMVIIINPSSHLVHILWITSSSACSWALPKAGAQCMQNYIHCLPTSNIHCFRCNAPLCDMDSGWFIQHSEAHSKLLCKSYKLQELWDDYGIIGYIKVMFLFSSMYIICTNTPLVVVHYPFSMCRYPWFTISQYSTSTHQRHFQRSHCHLGKWLYQGHLF